MIFCLQNFAFKTLFFPMAIFVKHVNIIIFKSEIVFARFQISIHRGKTKITLNKTKGYYSNKFVITISIVISF